VVAAGSASYIQVLAASGIYSFPPSEARKLRLNYYRLAGRSETRLWRLKEIHDQGREILKERNFGKYIENFK